MKRFEPDKYWDHFFEVAEGLFVRVHSRPYKPRFWGFPDMVSDKVFREFDRYVHAQPVVLWMTPTLTVAITPPTPEEKRRERRLIGRVAWSRVEQMNINFRKVGNAQAWLSTLNGYCIIWECFLHSGFFIEDGKPVSRYAIENILEKIDWETLGKLWDWFEVYLQERFGARKFLTHDSDPIYEGIVKKTPVLQKRYVKFLRGRGYRYKPQKKRWRYRTMVKEARR